MKSKILIVDDTFASRETLEALLQPQGYALSMAENGIEALKMAEKVRPDLILLDVMMPGMDGFEACRRLRSTPGLAEVPIILITALDDKESRIMGLEAGADDFLSKPFDRHELSARVRTITRLNRYHTLLEQRENLRNMAERLITAQEAERTRISGELHDELGQLLTAELMDIRDLQSDPNLSADVLFKRLEDIHNQTHEIAVKIRGIAHDLRPPLLDTLGLKSALQAHCSKFSSNSHIPIQVDIEDTVNDLPDVYGITIYRILQEALNNIIKHANASQIWVELSREDDQIHLTVQDNGHGLPTDPINGGIGITGMRERIALVGGEFRIRNGKNGGAILQASMPVRPASLKTMEGET